MPSIMLPGSKLPVHLAVPAVGAGPWPAVVVLHEILGLTDDIRQQADRLAAAGYLAVAPDLFSRGGAMRCLRSTFSALMSGRGQAYDDIEAARAYAAGRPDTTGKVGVIGFCMGGGFALMTAPRGFDVAAPNYGQLPKNAAQVLSGSCPVVASYGKRDVALRNAGDTLTGVLTELDVAHDVKTYDGVGHSFMNRHSLGPFGVLEKVVGLHYDEPSAEDAWTRILRFFDTHLDASPA